MDYRQTYEILLKTICENDKRILQLLASISRYDDYLLEVSMQEAPNPLQLESISLQKERLIQQLEDASIEEEQNVSRLNSAISLCSEIACHPLYYKIELLHTAISERMQTVLQKEDSNNPLITNRLSQYQEKLELDVSISEVPMEKRHIFYLYPNRD